MKNQQSLLDESKPDDPRLSKGRIEGLAGIMAGMVWPGHGGFEKLSKRRQEAARREAREALARLVASEE